MLDSPNQSHAGEWGFRSGGMRDDFDRKLREEDSLDEECAYQNGTVSWRLPTSGTVEAIPHFATF